MSSLETVIKTVVGDAAYITEQEFLTVEDAYNDRNPLTEAKATVSDVRINSTRYKLKDVSKSQNDGSSNTTTNNIPNG
jgi:hypothetical protein